MLLRLLAVMSFISLLVLRVLAAFRGVVMCLYILFRSLSVRSVVLDGMSCVLGFSLRCFLTAPLSRRLLLDSIIRGHRSRLLENNRIPLILNARRSGFGISGGVMV